MICNKRDGSLVAVLLFGMARFRVLPWSAQVVRERPMRDIGGYGLARRLVGMTAVQAEPGFNAELPALWAAVI